MMLYEALLLSLFLVGTDGDVSKTQLPVQHVKTVARGSKHPAGML